ncbi:NB-ARC domain-containing protein [Roseofilum reptotaenium CS-1145]|uniref:Uncharacterized protein n=1 Tax=Roseofilum reptotaenium AO1-A TaxID=1925591 RepID=A0A1L9QKE2_9CYAN|nr:NB-ARC domain-containing protein [Roseofilum reptotaenium]MDB9516895.1 NB-ARC domain-containing protein [Roseofilum reptotaenium CS-1145]OJJ16506.1 hypothetical protein BI308_23585 [Roseofilum reptotaenium AO1-A]
MDVTEALQFADRLVFETTGKHLDDSQETVIKGVWNGQTYEEIADDSHRSERHIRDVGYKLWKLLSNTLSADVKKSNFRSTIERLSIQYNQKFCIGTHNYFNFSTPPFPQGDRQNSDDSSIDTHSQVQSIHHDLVFAPEIIHFYNREPELNTIYHWIFERQTRLISVLGQSGIGKTALIKKFIDCNLEKFELITWRSLKYPISLEEQVDGILRLDNKQSQSPLSLDQKLKELFYALSQKKYLIIFDNVENIFAQNTWAGQYQASYQDYQHFFRMMVDLEHQSHLVLISREKCAEMECWDDELYPIKSLQLSGLYDVEFINHLRWANGNHETWLKLIHLYEGNPIYLQSVSRLIHQVFGSDVELFLTEKSLVITQQMQALFQEVFNRLSPVEVSVILALSKLDHPASRDDLMKAMDCSSVDLIYALESLQSRYLIWFKKQVDIQFDLNPVFKAFVKEDQSF